MWSWKHWWSAPAAPPLAACNVKCAHMSREHTWTGFYHCARKQTSVHWANSHRTSHAQISLGKHYILTIWVRCQTDVLYNASGHTLPVSSNNNCVVGLLGSGSIICERQWSVLKKRLPSLVLKVWCIEEVIWFKMWNIMKYIPCVVQHYNRV